MMGVADNATLQAIAAELRRDREVRILPDGSIESIDDSNFVIGFRVTVRRPFALPGEISNAPGSVIFRPVNSLGVPPPGSVIRPRSLSHEVWSTAATPVSIDNGPDPTIGPLCLPPPTDGTRIRFVDIPPDTEDFLKHGAARMKDAFSQVGDINASTVRPDSPHPLMHRTETVDYGIVISGEITLVLEKGEANLKAGDVVIQRGTNHGCRRAPLSTFYQLTYYSDSII